MNIEKIKKSSSKIVRGLNALGYLRWVPDNKYLNWRYKTEFRENLELRSPSTYNEKLQWLKLYDRKSRYTQLVDKFEVRKYVEEKIGSEYLVPLVGNWNNVQEIDWSLLPNQFVIKCTHDSGGLVICKDKNNLNIKKTKNKIKRSLARNYYYAGREWPYKNINPKIICEEYLQQPEGEEIRDYRVFCFNGDPKFIAVDFNITDKSKTKRNLYDLNWDLMDAEISYPRELDYKLERPKKLNEMIELSKKLSEKIPHARIDFYYINDKIIFGEITLFHQSGLGKVTPKSFDKLMGDWIVLPTTDA